MRISGVSGSNYVPGEAGIDGGLDLANIGDTLKLPAGDITKKIAQIQQDTNRSNTDKMMDMQVELNLWSTLTSLRTNLIKSVSDSLKAIVRNIV